MSDESDNDNGEFHKLDAAVLEIYRMMSTGELEKAVAALPHNPWPMVPRRRRPTDRAAVRAFHVLASSKAGTPKYERALQVFESLNLNVPSPRVISTMRKVAHRGIIDAELVFDFLYGVPSVRQIARIARWLGANDREILDWCWLGE